MVAEAWQGFAPPVSGGGRFVAVSGKAELVRDKAEFKAHWNPDLDTWFDQGVDTPDLAMIHVKAERVECWDGKDQGEIRL